MKYIRWKSLIITSIVCLLPILLGLALWNDLPDTMSIHFNIYGEADGFAPKSVVVFGFPFMMVALQCFCCFINDINAAKHGLRVKFERVTKWIIPYLSIALQIVTMGFGLGWNIDIRRVVALIVGIEFLVLGNYLPKLDYVKNYNLDTDKARKVNRFVGFATVIMGVLMLITMFLPPVSLYIWFILMIVYTIVTVIYGIVISKKS